MAPRLAILVAYGPEARAFVHSGLAARLADEWELLFAASEPEAPSLAAAPGLRLAAPRAVEPVWLTRLHRLRSRLPAAGSRAFLARAAESAGVRFGGGSSAWKDWLRRHRIDAVLAGSFQSVRTRPALASASQLEIPSVVCANSWKDVPAKPHCGVRLGALGVFTAYEREAFLAVNPGFAPARVEAIGSLHCAALANARPVSREALLRSVHLDPQRPFVCYPASRLGQGDIELIERLLKAISRLPERPQLLVRLNPMDPADWIARFRGRAGIGFDRPRWDWRPETEWISPLPEDGPRWAAQLVDAAAIVSKASTVVWEAAALGRQVLTIAWGDDRTAWDAPDFREARRQGWTRGVTAENALAESLRAELSSPGAPARRPPTDAIERARDLLKSAEGAAVESPPTWAQAATGGVR
ncbi:MAG: hypothetical protein GC160_21870 [Acidobacteria bacterium]|nr:hypothetical protein [Acidobacteriota bacterium]